MHYFRPQQPILHQPIANIFQAADKVLPKHSIDIILFCEGLNRDLRDCGESLYRHLPIQGV